MIADKIQSYLQIGGYKTPVEWAKEKIDFSLDTSASKRKLDFEFSPFLIDPINAWDFTDVKREVTVVAPEQTGKTLCWLVGMLWSFQYKPCLSLVVYKSDEMAEKINQTKLKPLMQKIPFLSDELSLPRSNRKDHYNFSNLKSYFMGSGSRITSMSSKICIADELDDWQEHEGQVSNLDDLRKRSRSFSESMLYKVCSPKSGGDLNNSAIWEEFKEGSKGYWTLKCDGCSEHTIRSCDTHHLQFKSKDYKVTIGSCILVCPKCGHEHLEDRKRDMNLNGKYIHEVPELIHTKPSFQWGCLASQNECFNWDLVAQAQLDAGSSGSLKKQILFDNSFRGLPFHHRRKNDKREQTFLSHQIDLPPQENIKYRLISVDTQDDCFYYVCRGFDNFNNSYLLEASKVIRIEDLDNIWNKDFYGGKACLGIIDQGGHRGREVSDFVNNKAGFYMYKGRGSNAYSRWEASKNCKKLILVSANIYKAELLYAMYNTENKGRNYWFLNKKLPKFYVDQMLEHKPDNAKREGSKYINYVSSGNDHCFDCEKQILVLNEMYIHFMNIQNKKKRK